MKNLTIIPVILGFLLSAANVNAQDSDSDQVYIIVEKMPKFPGGDAGLIEYIQNNIKYPQLARDAAISGAVYVGFVVDKKGAVKNAKILRGIGGGCDEEALRVVNAMPDWTPGTQRGKTVSVQYTLPIKFKLTNVKPAEKNEKPAEKNEKPEKKNGKPAK